MNTLVALRTLVRRRLRPLGVASFGALSIIGAFVVPRPEAVAGPTARVAHGPFVETISEAGTVESARLLLYGSTVAGAQVKIAELTPESRVVQPGDVLIRFDSTTFEQRLAREEAESRQAEAELQRAREELRLDRLHGDSETAQARQQIGYAQTALTNETDGKGRVQQAEAEAAEADAAREVETAGAAYEDMRPMLERGFITRVELKRAEQTLTHAQEQLRLAQLRREAVSGFERPAATARSKAELDAAKQALERQQQSVQARAAEHEAAVRIAASRVDEIAARMALLRDQISRCVVRADAAGMVVYRELYFGNDRRKPQVGDEVWSNQPLIALPDKGQLTVETRIREIDLHHVAVGGATTVTLPAYPSLELKGSVAVIGALAQADPARAGTKFFPVTIAIDTKDDRLRTGMTAKVDIEVAAYPDATLVPAQAVFSVEGRPSIFVVAHGRAAARPVTISAENNSHAVVTSGAAPGEVVLLIDPRNQSSTEGGRR